eukprot:SAG11_NODE_957_length_6394_cov_4.145512_5_plen_101_part_00
MHESGDSEFFLEIFVCTRYAIYRSTHAGHGDMPRHRPYPHGYSEVVKPTVPSINTGRYLGKTRPFRKLSYFDGDPVTGPVQPIGLSAREIRQFMRPFDPE